MVLISSCRQNINETQTTTCSSSFQLPRYSQDITALLFTNGVFVSEVHNSKIDVKISIEKPFLKWPSFLWGDGKSKLKLVGQLSKPANSQKTEHREQWALFPIAIAIEGSLRGQEDRNGGHSLIT